MSIERSLSLILHKFETNPQDQELRLHPLTGRLSGKQAASLICSCRIALRLILTEPEVVLLNVGSHDEVCGRLLE